MGNEGGMSEPLQSLTHVSPQLLYLLVYTYLPAFVIQCRFCQLGSTYVSAFVYPSLQRHVILFESNENPHYVVRALSTACSTTRISIHLHPCMCSTEILEFLYLMNIIPTTSCNPFFFLLLVSSKFMVVEYPSFESHIVGKADISNQRWFENGILYIQGVPVLKVHIYIFELKKKWSKK